MLMELMSDGSLAKLPPDPTIKIKIPEQASIMVLMPHNKYLIGSNNGNWIYGAENNMQPIFLYDDENLNLRNDSVIIPAKTVNELRNKLLLQMSPPGNHNATILMLKTFMRENQIFDDENKYKDEKIFMQNLENDQVLKKIYWALRFAMYRGELESIPRYKSWLKAVKDEPGIFEREDHQYNIWFSLQDMPDENALNEIENLGFPREDVKRISEQNISPILLFSPASGYLLLGRFGRNGNPMFFVWIYLNSALWNDLHEIKKLGTAEVILSVWGQHDIQESLSERSKYKS